jgi:hypothetical protein
MHRDAWCDVLSHGKGGGKWWEHERSKRPPCVGMWMDTCWYLTLSQTTAMPASMPILSISAGCFQRGSTIDCMLPLCAGKEMTLGNVRHKGLLLQSRQPGPRY